MTAAQYAIRCAESGNKVTMLSRNQIDVHQFDSDPCWLGPKCLNGFSKIESLEKRRRIIKHARQLGSINPQVHSKLKYWRSQGRLKLLEASVNNLKHSHGNFVIGTDEGSIQVNQIVLATGFKKECPGGKLVSNIAIENRLPMSHCGYPIVDSSLRWGKRIFVSGALADLELGPASRNISGARMAATRITSHFLNAKV